MSNEHLRHRRESTPSPSGSGRPMTRRELAEAVNQYLWKTTGKDCHLTVDTLRRYEQGHTGWPGAMYREAFRAVLGVETDAELGFIPTPRGKNAAQKKADEQADHANGSDELTDTVGRRGPLPTETAAGMDVSVNGSHSGDTSPSPIAPSTRPGAWELPQWSLAGTSYAQRSRAVPNAEVDAGPAADAAARESWWHLAMATAAVDPMGIETVHEAIVRLARQYDVLPPSDVLVAARETRDLAYVLLEQTRRPAQLVNLNLDAGVSCALLAVASFDLGQPEASVAQARAAAKYADVIGHPGLKAWSMGHLSLVAYWSGNPQDAIRIADLALADAPDGSASARLHAIRARACALIGDKPEVADSLRRADEAVASSDGTEEVHDEIGGEFAWGPMRNATCAGTALVTVGEPSKGANRLRETISAAPGTVSRHLVRRSRVDLASAELTAGRFDAAVDQMQYVWSTPVDQRRVGLTGRLDRVQNTLGDPIWKKYRPASALNDQITTFTEEASDHRALLVAGGVASGEIAP